MKNKWSKWIFQIPLLIITLVSCTLNQIVPSKRVVPLNVLDTSSPIDNFDDLFQFAKDEVYRDVPGATFRGMVFSGGCAETALLNGKLIFIFVQEKQGLLRNQIIRSVATIDTLRSSMLLSFSDETDHYPNLDASRIPTQIEIKKVFDVIQQNTIQLPLNVCSVVVTQTELSWNVRCGTLRDFVVECGFEVMPNGTKTNNLP